MVMNINDLCSKFDKHEIVATHLEIDRDYYASSDLIYTDGEAKYNVDAIAYIHITSVHNANYIMFIDIESKIYLCIYKYIPESKFKQIMQKLQILKQTLGVDKHDEIDYIETHIDNDVIDINIFTCTECDCKNKMAFTRLSNPDILFAKCDKCKTEYTFTPSKYYKMASKKIIYFKSEESSRDIKVINNSVTTTSTNISTSSSTKQSSSTK